MPADRKAKFEPSAASTSICGVGLPGTHDRSALPLRSTFSEPSLASVIENMSISPGSREPAPKAGLPRSAGGIGVAVAAESFGSASCTTTGPTGGDPPVGDDEQAAPNKANTATATILSN